MKKVGIIMAGGAGERFWPLSRKKFPKQLLRLNSEEFSIIEETLNRVSALIPLEDIFIITNELLVEEIRRFLPNLPPQNVIPEPAKRNTAPCLALVSAYISAKYSHLKSSEILISVLTADQNIFPENKFIETLNFILNFIEKNEKLATIGIKPTRPDTGFGYIETENKFANDKNKIEIQPVIRFREKPNITKAEEYVETGKFVWNSGMFFWRLDVFEAELIKHSPEIGSTISQFAKLLKQKTNIAFTKSDNEINDIFSALPSISIDYALMEKSENVMVCKAIFEWDDIGSWDSLERTKEIDENQNVKKGKLSIIDCKNSIFVNEAKEKNVIVAGFGLENIVVVATDDAILVCAKDKTQEIKLSIEDIKNKFGEKYL
jgi:mannose-1-phosphate guanylyltransferase